MTCQTYLSSKFQLNLWIEEQNTTHKSVTWWDHIRASAYTPIPGLDAGRVTPELKLRLKFYWSWTWWDFFFFCFCLLNYCGGFYLYFYSYFLFSFHTINFTITIFSSLFSPPSLSLLLLCYNPLFSFPNILSAPSLSPCLHLPITSSSNLSMQNHSLLLLTNLLYQIYMTQTSAIPDTSTLHYNNRSTAKHTQEPQNSAAPTRLLPLTHPTSASLFSVTLTNFPNFYG
jgi:hypothetical protein